MQNSNNCSESCDCNAETYLEIYKLQTDTITKTSDRRVNVSRYYIFAISALVLALSVVSSSEFLEIINPIDFEKSNSEGSKSIAFSLGVTGGLGSILTFSWLLNMFGYLSSNSKRYEKIKDLECYLPYQFTKSMGLDFGGSDKKYFYFARHELLAPLVFCVGFTIFALFGFGILFSLKIKELSFLISFGVFVVIAVYYKMYLKEKANV